MNIFSILSKKILNFYRKNLTNYLKLRVFSYAGG